MRQRRIGRDFSILLNLFRKGTSYICYIRMSDDYIAGSRNPDVRFYLHESGDTIEGSGVTILKTLPEVINHLKIQMIKWWPLDPIKDVKRNDTLELLGVDIAKAVEDELSWVYRDLGKEWV